MLNPKVNVDDAHSGTFSTDDSRDGDLPTSDPRYLAQIAWTLKAILAIASIYLLKFTSVVLIPIALAFLVYILLSPFCNALGRLIRSKKIAAASCMILLFLPLVVTTSFLSDPAAAWLQNAPTSLVEVRRSFYKITAPFETVVSASDAVTEAIDDIQGTSDEKETVVKVKEPGLLESAFVVLPELIAQLVFAVAIAFLLLIYGDRLQMHLLAGSARIASRRRIIRGVRQMKHDVSRYLSTLLLMNTALAISCAGVFWLLNVPNPLLWGVVAGFMNFAPYVGALVTAGLLLMVGMSEFSTMEETLLPVFAFGGLTLLEGQFITPLVLGKRLSLNPVITVVAVISFGWLWGFVGALMAVPLLVTARIVFELARVEAAPS